MHFASIIIRFFQFAVQTDALMSFKDCLIEIQQ